MVLKRMLLLSGAFLYQQELFSRSLLYEIMVVKTLKNLPTKPIKYYSDRHYT